MQKWEYKTESTFSELDDNLFHYNHHWKNEYLEKSLKIRGDEGWELINVVYAPLQDKASSDIIYYFKRPKAETLK